MNIERLLAIWWSMTWRFLIVSVILGFVLGAIGGGIVGAAGHPELGAAVGAILGWIGSIPASMWSLGAALKKHKLV